MGSDFLLLTCRCGARYTNRLGAAQSHKDVFGHWPREAPTYRTTESKD